MVKILKLYDFTKCELPDKLFEIKIKQKDIDDLIEKAAEHFLTIKEREGAVQKGDIAAVKIECADPVISSECERFSVGKGYFYAEIDSAVVGKKKGDVFSVNIGGTDAKVSLLWVRYRSVPEFTDDMAAKMGIEDVSTVGEYTDYVTDELVNAEKEKKQEALWLLVSKKIIEESLFEVDESEIEEQYEKDVAYLENELEGDFEEYMQVKYHGKTLDESKKNFRGEIEKTLKLCAVAEPMAKEDGVEWTRDDYEATIDEMVSEDYSKEELMESMSYEDYVKQQKETYLKAKIFEYFDERFNVEII